ncbi:MAG: hypothetical protein KA764_16060 [Anaerolineales bacterium]|nr:hypothetical protein [Anaerolineales bacterium]
MCVFCAAVPSALAWGAVAHGRQRQAARRAEAGAAESASPPASPTRLQRVPVAKTTAAVVVLLVAASVIYHTQAPA